MRILIDIDDKIHARALDRVIEVYNTDTNSRQAQRCNVPVAVPSAECCVHRSKGKEGEAEEEKRGGVGGGGDAVAVAVAGAQIEREEGRWSMYRYGYRIWRGLGVR